MKNVVIVESPAKCKTINKYLGKDYTVLASFGHIRDLPSKDGSVRPDEDFAMDYQISSGSTKNVKEISDALKGAEKLILATDPDREGEAISWHVLEAMKQKKAIKKDTKIERVSFSSITKKAVTEAMENPRDVDMNLVNAQQARRALDYLVGFNLSPVLWRKLPGSKSAGRVQSVALRLICEREGDIEKFISQEFWDIKGLFNNSKNQEFSAKLTHIEGKKLDKFDIAKGDKAQEIAKNLASKDYKIAAIEKKQSRRNPYAPFTTSTLQQEASRKLGFSAKRTMQVAQRLYEGIALGGETSGLITYMRTDGVTVAGEAIAASRNLITKKFGDEYLPKSPRIYQSKAKNAQEAHEAIRPTDPMREPAQIRSYLDDDQFKLYDLIWKRLIASQMESVVLDQVAADVATSDGYANLRATGSTVKFAGFYKLYREDIDDKSSDDDDEKTLPPLEKDEIVTLKDADPAQHFTQPPPRFSEASLVKKLEELGIGRPSTYASILSVLQEREYVKLDKKRFMPEVRGRLVTSFLTSFFTKYLEYDFTANLENELDTISAGDLDWKKSLSNFWGEFKANVDEAMELDFTSVIDKLNELLEVTLYPGEGTLEERRKCPKGDGGELSLKLGKFGAFVGCSHYPDCNYTRQIMENDGAAASGGFDEPKILGKYPETGEDITLKKGPYGFYLQVGEAVKAAKGEKAKKPKRASIPKARDPQTVDLAIALDLLSLPRDVGIHPETNKKIVANIGPYGPYIRHDAKFTSLKGDDDVLTVTLERAVQIIKEAPVKKGAEPLRVIGDHPESGESVAVYDGRYGPYVKHQKVNASLPKTESADNITMETAIELLDAQAAKKGGGKAKKKSATKKKVPAKKKPATKKKATPKKVPEKN